MASPVAAGLAGLMRDLRPDLTPAQTGGVIQATAADRGAPGRDASTGPGVIDAEAALRAAATRLLSAPPRRTAAAGGRRPGRQAPALRTARASRYRCTVGARTVPTGARAARRRARRPVSSAGAARPPRWAGGLQVQRLAEGPVDQGRVVPHEGRGRFRFMVRLRRTGPWTIRAAVAATAARAASAGPRAKLAVTRSS